MSRPWLAPFAAALLVSACVHTTPPDLDALWDHERPAVSEERFRALLSGADAQQSDARLEAETQLARSLGLQQRFDEAHALLDGVLTALGDAPEREAERAPSRALVRARYHLERGRTLRSGGDAAAARPEFQRALEVADAAHLEFFAADALHMLALVAPPAEQVAAHEAAIARIERSTDARARLARAAHQ